MNFIRSAIKESIQRAVKVMVQIILVEPTLEDINQKEIRLKVIMLLLVTIQD